MIEPGYPFQGRQFDGLAHLPGSTAMYQFCLVQTVDGLGQRIVVAVALTAHGRFNAGFRQAFTVADGDVLRAPVAVMNQCVVTLRWRAYSACSKASKTKSVRIELLTRQATM